MRTWWKAFARLHAAGPGARQGAGGKANSTRPALESLEGRTLLSTASGGSIVASFFRSSGPPMGPSAEIGVSRIDLHTGHETILVRQSGMYDSTGPVAAAANGDILFALTEFNPSSGPQAVVRRIDAHTGKATTLFTTPGLDGLAAEPDGEVVVSWSPSARAGGQDGISRVDPYTGHETVLFSKQAGMYDGVGAVAVAADGDVLFGLNVGLSGPASIQRYDAATGKTSQLAAIPGGARIDSLAVKPDGAVVASYTSWSPAGEDLRVSRFDPKTGHQDVLFSKPRGAGRRRRLQSDRVQLLRPAERLPADRRPHR